MSFLLLIKKALDRVLDFLVMAVFAILTAVVVWQVFTRYVIGLPSEWTEELATFLMIWIGLLGACVALRLRAHLGIDYVVRKFSPRGQMAAEVFSYLMIALFSTCVLLGGGSKLVHLVWVNGQASPALGLPMAVVYAALPVSGFFLTLYSLALLYETILLEAGRKAARPEQASDLPKIIE